jgi:hypothetical protein
MSAHVDDDHVLPAKLKRGQSLVLRTFYPTAGIVFHGHLAGDCKARVWLSLSQINESSVSRVYKEGVANINHG